MSFTSKGTSEIIVAGSQDVMLVIDLNKGEVVKQVSGTVDVHGSWLTTSRCLQSTITHL